jgi:hypothetical protein
VELIGWTDTLEDIMPDAQMAAIEQAAARAVAAVFPLLLTYGDARSPLLALEQAAAEIRQRAMAAGLPTS